MKNYDFFFKCHVPSPSWRTWFKRDFLLFIVFELTLAFLGKRVYWFSVEFSSSIRVVATSRKRRLLTYNRWVRERNRFVYLWRLFFVRKNSTASAGNWTPKHQFHFTPFYTLTTVTLREHQNIKHLIPC